MPKPSSRVRAYQVGAKWRPPKAERKRPIGVFEGEPGVQRVETGHVLLGHPADGELLAARQLDHDRHLQR